MVGTDHVPYEGPGCQPVLAPAPGPVRLGLAHWKLANQLARSPRLGLAHEQVLELARPSLA